MLKSSQFQRNLANIAIQVVCKFDKNQMKNVVKITLSLPYFFQSRKRRQVTFLFTTIALTSVTHETDIISDVPIRNGNFISESTPIADKFIQ